MGFMHRIFFCDLPHLLVYLSSHLYCNVSCFLVSLFKMVLLFHIHFVDLSSCISTYLKWHLKHVKLLPLLCFCFALCRKPEALWETALASCVVPEGGGPLPTLSEGARAWGGDPAQAAHQTGLVFLETPILLSACLLKGALHWLFHPNLGHHTQENQPPPLLKHTEEIGSEPSISDRNDSQCYLCLNVSMFGGMYVPLYNCGWLDEWISVCLCNKCGHNWRVYAWMWECVRAVRVMLPSWVLPRRPDL